MELAKLMADCNFVPPHLRKKPGDCLAIVMQAARWGMDPFAVANKTFFVNDRIAYEAQLINAVVNSSGLLKGRLRPEWDGEGDALSCTVTGNIRGEEAPLKRKVEIKTITTKNSPLWKQDPSQQLAYYAQRAWARLYTPEVILGVYTPDEVEAMDPAPASVTPARTVSISDMIEAGGVGMVKTDPVAVIDGETGEILDEATPAGDGAADDVEPSEIETRRLIELFEAVSTEAQYRWAGEQFQKSMAALSTDQVNRIHSAMAAVEARRDAAKSAKSATIDQDSSKGEEQ